MKIDKNIPVPQKFPFGQMEVNDSFEIPKEVNRQTVSTAAARYSRKTGKKFITRVMPDKTFRCWRVS
jgi:hypothetical protein